MRLTAQFESYLNRMLEQFLAKKLTVSETYQFILDCYYSNYVDKLPPDIKKLLVDRARELEKLH